MFSKLKEFYSREDTNISRQKNIDYAKAIAIIGMILVHIFLYPYYAGFQNDGLSYFVGYIFGGLMAAPIFMTSMGVGLSYSTNSNPKQIIIRGLKLVGMNYVLNVVRSIYSFVAILSYEEDFLGNVLYYIFNGDILVFAGLALILFGLLKMIKKNSNLWILVTSVVMLLISTIFKVRENDSELLAYTLGLFIPVNFSPDPVVCFQLFSWFIFVAIGYLLGITIRKIKNLDKFYLISGIIGAVVMTTVLLLDYYLGLEEYFVTYTSDAEYMVGLGYALIGLGSVFFEFALLHFLCKLTPKKLDSIVFTFASAINEIYIVSWIIILNISYAILLPIMGEDPIDPLPYYLSFLVVFPLSTWLGLLWRKLKKRKTQQN